MTLPDTYFDYLIVLIVVVSAGYAAWRGFLWETLTIFAWVAAGLACLYFGPAVIPLIRSYVHQAWLASILAYAGVFLVVFIPLAFISRRFSDSVKRSPIGLLDRVAGFGFGVVRGLVILGLAYGICPFRPRPQAAQLGHRGAAAAAGPVDGRDTAVGDFRSSRQPLCVPLRVGGAGSAPDRAQSPPRRRP